MTLFRSRPVTIHAVQWFKDGDHSHVVVDDRRSPYAASSARMVKGAQGWSTVNAGDWIINEPRDPGFYPCNPEVFAAKYEPVDEPPEAA